MAKMGTWAWKHAAKYCEDVFGAYVDWDERFFECPECAEPIYESDWINHDPWHVCPVCDFDLTEDEE